MRIGFDLRSHYPFVVYVKEDPGNLDNTYSMLEWLDIEYPGFTRYMVDMAGGQGLTTFSFSEKMIALRFHLECQTLLKL